MSDDGGVRGTQRLDQRKGIVRQRLLIGVAIGALGWYP